MQTQAYEQQRKPEWSKTQRYEMLTQAREVAKFSDVSLPNGKMEN